MEAARKAVHVAGVSREGRQLVERHGDLGAALHQSGNLDEAARFFKPGGAASSRTATRIADSLIDRWLSVLRTPLGAGPDAGSLALGNTNSRFRRSRSPPRSS